MLQMSMLAVQFIMHVSQNGFIEQVIYIVWSSFSLRPEPRD